MRRTLMSLVHPVASGIALLAVAASAGRTRILYNNAARFLRLDKATTTSSNGSSGQ